MNVKKVVLVGVVLVSLIIVGLVSFIGNGNSEVNKKDGDITAIEKRGQEQNEIRLKEEETERMKYDQQFKDADEFVYNYMVAKMDGNNPKILDTLLKETSTYQNFVDSTNVNKVENEGKFDKDVYYYRIIRYASKFEESGRLYYDYTILSLDQLGKTDNFVGTLILVKNNAEEWKIENIIHSLPNDLEKYGATVTDKKYILNQELYESYPFK